MEPNELYGWILQWLQAHVGQAIAYPLLALLLAGAGIMAWRKAKEFATKGAAFVDRAGKTLDALELAIESGKKTAQTVQELHDIQAIQAENHLHTIEGEAVKQTAILTDLKTGQAVMEGKFDTLIGVMRDKA